MLCQKQRKQTFIKSTESISYVINKIELKKKITVRKKYEQKVTNYLILDNLKILPKWTTETASLHVSIVDFLYWVDTAAVGLSFPDGINSSVVSNSFSTDMINNEHLLFVCLYIWKLLCFLNGLAFIFMFFFGHIALQLCLFSYIIGFQIFWFGTFRWR